MTARATCASCRWWELWWANPTERTLGMCRRYAPRPKRGAEIDDVDDSSFADWPNTHESDWCGEHAPKEKGDGFRAKRREAGHD